MNETKLDPETGEGDAPRVINACGSKRAHKPHGDCAGKGRWVEQTKASAPREAELERVKAERDELLVWAREFVRARETQHFEIYPRIYKAFSAAIAKAEGRSNE
jgi:hypothetical protein